MRVLVVVNREIEDLGLYEEFLSHARLPHDVVNASEEDLPPLDRYDAVLVGGTPHPVYLRGKHPYLDAVYGYLGDAVRLRKPCFGVCGGAQLLAAALGARVGPGTEKEIGVYELALTSDGRADPLLRGFPDTFESFQWHGDTFEIPDGGKRLVESEACRNQMFRCGPSVGVQFHLEITRDEALRWAEAYRDDLTAFGKSIDDVAREFEGREAKMRELAFLLMRNYIDSLSM